MALGVEIVVGKRRELAAKTMRVKSSMAPRSQF
jgi:hypothetical protein